MTRSVNDALRRFVKLQVAMRLCVSAQGTCQRYQAIADEALSHRAALACQRCGHGEADNMPG